MDKKESTTIFVLGLRGFPNVQGGVETHAEHLYPLVKQMGMRVICATRSPYHNLREWSGVEFARIWAPRSRSLEAIVHSILAVFRAAVIRPDVVHIHAVGPSLVVPLARILGLKVVVTHHGPDYDREKWNAFAKAVLRLGERLGMKFANERIVISPVIAELVQQKYSVQSTIIPNGVRLPVLDADESILTKFGLTAGRYVLLVSRLVPEKRHFDLIEAFQKAGVAGTKLAIVGGADHPDSYQRSLISAASARNNVVMTGFLQGGDLKALFQFASVFVLPSSHEGLPISLLEALSFGLPCIASDIPANKSVGLDDEAYFELGNVAELAEKLAKSLSTPATDKQREAIREWVSVRFDWQEIARKTADVYENALS